ncbi:unnamed protein product, partial [Larinioides sclopetarius]
MTSTAQTGTDLDPQKQRLRNENRDLSSAITQDVTPIGEHQPPIAPFHQDENSNHSPDASDGAAASLVQTGTDPDIQSGNLQDASTYAEAQPSSTDGPAEFSCSVCQGSSFREGQIKRLWCSHVFHQS